MTTIEVYHRGAYKIQKQICVCVCGTQATPSVTPSSSFSPLTLCYPLMWADMLLFSGLCRGGLTSHCPVTYPTPNIHSLVNFCHNKHKYTTLHYTHHRARVFSISSHSLDIRAECLKPSRPGVAPLCWIINCHVFYDVGVCPLHYQQ